MSQKRNRSINWDEEEKQLLRSVLKEFAQIIVNKCLDTNTNKVKTKAWEEVHKKFNQLNSRSRDLNQIKIQWKAMKIHAWKTYSMFKNEVHKTGGGARPATPEAAVVEIKDLLNPAELLRDHNVYDSDGIVIGDLDFPTLSETHPIKQKMCVETEDIDAQLAVQELSPLAVSLQINVYECGLFTKSTITFYNLQITQVKANTTTPVEKCMDKLLVKISEDDITVTTPLRESIDIISTKKVPKRKIMFNNIADKGTKFRKDQGDYVSSMLNHSKMLKDEEHMRRMEMAEEEHAIKMEVQREKLKSAILEREILELRKAREASSIQ
ncbi:unnamed protein product [Euphydryas editha]|uniref:Regulatory protein zeste n=1 Tax=Euphydryas editha TaxID=104508 RepID=A0AAU9UQE5_EUPED|nr:unnamed protein product [Euphydryas editha]